MLIHAYRRKAKHQVELFGQTIEFAPNAAGDVVAEVTDSQCIERLLAIPEGYRAHAGAEIEQAGESVEDKGEKGDKGDKGDQKPAASAFVLTKGTETLDLSKLGDDALKEFAKANGITVHHKAKGDTIRKAIVDALKGVE